MPAVASFLIEPIWDQFQELIPEHRDVHPLGCHRPRIPDRIIFNKLVQVLVLGCAYAKIADSACSATTLRDRRDAWITAGIFTRHAQSSSRICVEHGIGELKAWRTLQRWIGRRDYLPETIAAIAGLVSDRALTG